MPFYLVVFSSMVVPESTMSTDRVAMLEMFKKIPQNVEKPLTTREKKSKIDYRYLGWMVFGKICKGTTTIEENKTNLKGTGKA